MGQLPFLEREPREGRYYAKQGWRILHRGAYGKAEDISIPANENAPGGHSGRLRIAITYFGAACWRVGNSQAMIDSNSLLFFSPGEEFSDREIGSPVGRSAVLLTIPPDIVDEICSGGAAIRKLKPTTISAPASPRVHLLAQALLSHGNKNEVCSSLYTDELLLETFLEALNYDSRDATHRARTLVNRAKEFLHGLPDDDAISLSEVANAVGCSPIYLTQSFHRQEGLPLYRYHLRLRLSRALLHLRTTSEITPLAFQLGFSSHSHFTSAFRTAFGLSPSQYRSLIL